MTLQNKCSSTSDIKQSWTSSLHVLLTDKWKESRGAALLCSSWRRSSRQVTGSFVQTASFSALLCSSNAAKSPRDGDAFKTALEKKKNNNNKSVFHQMMLVCSVSENEHGKKQKYVCTDTPTPPPPHPCCGTYMLMTICHQTNWGFDQMRRVRDRGEEVKCGFEKLTINARQKGKSDAVWRVWVGVAGDGGGSLLVSVETTLGNMSQFCRNHMTSVWQGLVRLSSFLRWLVEKKTSSQLIINSLLSPDAPESYELIPQENKYVLSPQYGQK